MIITNIIFADSAECCPSCRSADLIVEVAHPSISAEYGAEFLKAADFMVRMSLVPAEMSMFMNLVSDWFSNCSC